MKKKYDLTRTFEVRIIKPMSTIFRVGMYAVCRYTSERGDFTLKMTIFGESVSQEFGFACQSHIKEISWMDIAEREFLIDFGSPILSKARRHILDQREKQKNENLVVEDGKFAGWPIKAYPMTEKECFPGPDPQGRKSQLLKNLFNNLNPSNIGNIGVYIHKEAEKFLDIIADLRSRSPYYPDILQEIHGSEIFYSTLVRIQRISENPAEKMTYYWYAIQTVQFYNYARPKCPEQDKFDCIGRLISDAYKVQLFYKNPTVEEIDRLQISEEDRLNQGITK